MKTNKLLPILLFSVLLLGMFGACKKKFAVIEEDPHAYTKAQSILLRDNAKEIKLLGTATQDVSFTLDSLNIDTLSSTTTTIQYYVFTVAVDKDGYLCNKGTICYNKPFTELKALATVSCSISCTAPGPHNPYVNCPDAKCAPGESAICQGDCGGSCITTSSCSSTTSTLSLGGIIRFH